MKRVYKIQNISSFDNTKITIAIICNTREFTNELIDMLVEREINYVIFHDIIMISLYNYLDISTVLLEYSDIEDDQDIGDTSLPF